jgi:hypothetical protein
MGQLEEARPLYEERLQADREIDGDRDPDTLTSIYLLAILLKKQGKLVEAVPLYPERLERGWCCSTAWSIRRLVVRPSS